ncbi:hypothetical protein EI42_01707 [Thermosporothrix hazakensis]|jgi:hypothetical protein|uniref:Uncharacterized protein n=2 Tax=Thermosporothrix TaxID=768650 RepID=A0A326UB58_THEHA|nr:hypothetical protein [Thermosporothrix hazakensis]PZW32615.1 hypothetical protein EI42_01707 [Thermosporothrix hazakensis]BBH87528.1 hypothetical protein KTC_22790 [Thermosporothrix sp. COM3]GCE49969.1 hypothetical protein KTH_48380 [Thermosporothrix hazakensis]
MKLLCVSSLTLRLTFVFAILLGLYFWAGWIVPAEGVREIHMLISLFFVLSLWGIGIATSFLLPGKNLALGIVFFLVGGAVAVVGVNQDLWRAVVGIEAMNTIHLVLNIFSMCLGGMVVGRALCQAKTQAAN